MGDIYITREELKLPPYNIGNEENYDAKYLEVLQDLTKKVIDNLCCQSFDKEGTDETPVEERVDGNGKDTIFLPKKLITLKTVRVYSSSTNYTEYEADNFVAKKKYISWNVYTSVIVSPRLLIENFAEGNNNIGVLGIWGWATVPEPIKYLQGRLIQKIIEDDSFAEKLKAERTGDWDKTVMDDKGRILGDFELDNIIKQYSPEVTYVAI